MATEIIETKIQPQTIVTGPPFVNARLRAIEDDNGGIRIGKCRMRVYSLVLVPNGTAMIAQLRPKTEIMPMDLRSSWLYPISLSREFGSSIVWPSKERCGATTCGADRLCLRALLSNEGILIWRQVSRKDTLAASINGRADGLKIYGSCESSRPTIPRRMQAGKSGDPQ